MSAAATTAPSGGADTAKPAGGKRKLIIALAAVLVLGGGGGAGWYFTKGRAAAEGNEPVVEHAHPKGPPTFMGLEPMVVNLADPGGERMIQLGITIQLDDAKAAELVKAYLPGIRSNILKIVSQRTSAELLQREGKDKLAADIAREIALPLDVEMDEDDAPAHAASTAGHGAAKPGAAPAKKKRRPQKPPNPVQEVHFSNFIIQ